MSLYCLLWNLKFNVKLLKNKRYSNTKLYTNYLLFLYSDICTYLPLLRTYSLLDPFILYITLFFPKTAFVPTLLYNVDDLLYFLVGKNPSPSCFISSSNSSAKSSRSSSVNFFLHLDLLT